MDPKTREDVIKDVFAERAAAEEAEKERKKQEEAAAYENGWKTIYDALNKLNDTLVSNILRSNAEPTVFEWFDNVAVLVEKYDASRFEKARATFISAVKSVDDEEVRILVADKMRFIFKLAATKISPFEYAKAVYAFRELSEEIGGALGESDTAKLVIVQTWKDAVYLRHKGGPVKNILDIFKKTWFEKMIDDIKKADPKYEAPKFRLSLVMGDCGDK